MHEERKKQLAHKKFKLKRPIVKFLGALAAIVTN